MKCEPMKLPGGGVAIVCRSGYRKPPLCSVCRKTPAPLLCDFPAPRGKTCDAPLCRGCATRRAPDVDWCPSHPIPQAALPL